MKIEAKITTLRCFEKIRFCMKYLAKNELVRILIACLYTYCTLLYILFEFEALLGAAFQWKQKLENKPMNKKGPLFSFKCWYYTWLILCSTIIIRWLLHFDPTNCHPLTWKPFVFNLFFIILASHINALKSFSLAMGHRWNACMVYIVNSNQAIFKPFLCFPLIQIVISWVYYTTPFSLYLFCIILASQYLISFG